MKTVALILFLALLPAPAHARCAVHAAYEIDLPVQAGIDAYVIKPEELVSTTLQSWPARWIRPRWKKNALDTRELLADSADFIVSRSEKRGFINAQTRFAYWNELRHLARGDWPGVVLTERGNRKKIIGTLFYAIPWRMRESMPFYYRFNGRGNVPRQSFFDIYNMHHRNAPEVNYPVINFVNGGQFEIMLDFSELLYYYPFTIGLDAEAKFLFVDDPQRRDIAYLLPLLGISHELDRYSGVPVPKNFRDEQLRLVNDPEYKPYLLDRLKAIEASRLAGVDDDQTAKGVREFFRSIHRSIFETGDFQRTIMINTIYAQVSSRQPMDGEASLLKRYFWENFGFPQEPRYTVPETAEFGTPGILSEIFAIGADEYHFDQLDAISRFSGLIGRGAIVRRKPNLYGSGGCPSLLAAWFERATLDTRAAIFGRR